MRSLLIPFDTPWTFDATSALIGVSLAAGTAIAVYLFRKRKQNIWSIAAGVWLIPVALFFLFLLGVSFESEPVYSLFLVHENDPIASFFLFLSGLVGSIAGVMSVLAFLLPLRSFRRSWIGIIVALVPVGVFLLEGVFGEEPGYYYHDRYYKALAILAVVAALTICSAPQKLDTQYNQLWRSEKGAHR